MRTLLLSFLAFGFASSPPVEAHACGPGYQPPVIEHKIVRWRPYSPAMAMGLVREMAQCAPDAPCEALAQLRAYGATATPQLLAALAASADHEADVVAMLERSPSLTTAQELVRIGVQSPDDRDVYALFNAAGRMDPRVADDLARAIDASVTASRRSGISVAMSSEPRWVHALAAYYPNAQHPERVADALVDAASVVHLGLLQGLALRSGSSLAQVKLARGAVFLGTPDSQVQGLWFAALSSSSSDIRDIAIDGVEKARLDPRVQQRAVRILTPPPNAVVSRRLGTVLLLLGSADRRATEAVLSGLKDAEHYSRVQVSLLVIRNARRLAPAVLGQLRSEIQLAKASERAPSVRSAHNRALEVAEQLLSRP